MTLTDGHSCATLSQFLNLLHMKGLRSSLQHYFRGECLVLRVALNEQTLSHKIAGQLQLLVVHISH